MYKADKKTLRAINHNIMNPTLKSPVDPITDPVEKLRAIVLKANQDNPKCHPTDLVLVPLWAIAKTLDRIDQEATHA